MYTNSSPIDIQNLRLFKKDVIKDITSSPGRALTPEVKNDNFAPFTNANLGHSSQVVKIGRYLVHKEPIKENSIETHVAYNIETQEEKKVKILPIKEYQTKLSPYFVSGAHPHIINIEEIILWKDKCYAFFPKTEENLHFFIRRNQKLKEEEAKFYFKQIVESVRHCHENNIIIREIKLRKFVFSNNKRNHIVLNNLEEGLVLEDDESDHLYNKHGCLAYISPEILYSSNGYSGKAADMWSLGVVLYTMLVGQYPFHDSDVTNLFKKIRTGLFILPDYLSIEVKCLLKNLLNLDPKSRMLIDEILYHPWFKSSKEMQDKMFPHKLSSVKNAQCCNDDQTVPVCSESSLDMEDLSLNNTLLKTS